jgi:hypothetical protein
MNLYTKITPNTFIFSATYVTITISLTIKSRIKDIKNLKEV